jgi:CRISPR-associated protein Cmr2
MSDSALRPGALDARAALAQAGEGVAAQAQALYQLLTRLPDDAIQADHAEVGQGRQHVLLASAVAYCLGYELRAAGAAVEPDLLRLAALAHDVQFADDPTALLAAPARPWVADRRLFFDALPGSPFPINYFSSPAEQALYAAHLVAALPLPVPPNRPAAVAFREHPLGRGHLQATLAVVAGGPTRARDYVLEAPCLPEMRGASALLELVALIDVPALFGASFDEPEQAQRAEAIREWFGARTGLPPLDAPECVLHCGVDGVLAIAPAALADPLRDAIEALYADATLAGGAVAASRSCELLELQYGRHPARFWAQEYEAARADPDLRLLVADDRQFEAPLDPTGFPPHKGFGELAREMALLQQRRSDERASYPNWESVPYAQVCPACDLRPASSSVGTGELRCQPCRRKHEAGMGLAGGRTARPRRYLVGPAAAMPDGEAAQARSWQTEAPRDLNDIASLSSPWGYLGVIHFAVADLVDRRTNARAPHDYRAIGATVETATEQAVRAALARHLSPTPREGDLIHSAELLDLGADGALLIVPASVALALATSLARTFAEQCPAIAEGDPWAAHRYRPRPRDPDIPAPLPTTLSLSAGVVIAPSSVPFPLVADLAQDLLRSAARESALAERTRPDPHRGGYCDFLLLARGGMPGTRLADWRAERLQRHGRSSPELRLGAAPYTWPEIEGLLDSVRALIASGVTYAEIRDVDGQLARGEAVAAVEYLYRRSRAPQGVRTALGRLEEAWGTDGGHTEVSPPWRWLIPRDGRERRETIWPDLLAIYEFCAAQLAAEALHATH